MEKDEKVTHSRCKNDLNRRGRERERVNVPARKKSAKLREKDDFEICPIGLYYYVRLPDHLTQCTFAPTLHGMDAYSCESEIRPRRAH